VIELDAGIFDEREPDLCAVSGRDNRLVVLFGESPGGVQSIDLGPADVVDADEVLRAAVDDVDVESFQIRGVGPRPRPVAPGRASVPAVAGG